LSAFLYDLLGVKLNLKSENIQTEKKFKPPVGHIDFAYDIFVDAPDDRMIVEIQRVRYDDHYNRFFHYFVAAFAELPKSYREYRLEKTVYTIVWLTRKVNDIRAVSSQISFRRSRIKEKIPDLSSQTLFLESKLCPRQNSVWRSRLAQSRKREYHEPR